MNVTLDGFMSGPNCELDWHFQSWTEDMSDSLCEQLSKADTILLGRITYNAMAKYWQSKMIDTSFARKDIAFAEMMNRYKKIVFSKTLTAPDWYNSKLIRRNFGKEILKLKQLPGKDMIVYGSGLLVSALMQSRLIDEYVLWVHPVILGKGKLLFKGLHDNLFLRLRRTKKFSSGVVGLYYEAESNINKK